MAKAKTAPAADLEPTNEAPVNFVIPQDPGNQDFQNLCRNAWLNGQAEVLPGVAIPPELVEWFAHQAKA